MPSNVLATNTQPAIGNDIVDLGFIDSPAYQHIRHLERVCTKEESRAVRESSDPSRDLAVIWASKEATYKAVVNRGGDTKFVPREFVTHFERCEQLPSGYKLPVSHRGSSWHLQIALTERWVHAIALDPEHCVVRWAIAEIESFAPHCRTVNESAVARRIAVELLSASRRSDVVLQFAGRVPTVRKRRTGDSAGMGVSLSHDGAFAAAALAWAAGES